MTKDMSTQPPPSYNAARAYELMYRARRADEELAEEVKRGKLPLPIHLSIGQEAVSVGVCLALRKSDVVFGTYRGHALYLAKGGDLKKMFAELLGKTTGCAHGKGGSMHLVDMEAGVMGTSGVVGTGIPNATGCALGFQYKKQKRVVANFFGDGATEEGPFHESLNFAALKQLPIIYICENNGYAIKSRRAARQPDIGIAERARAYGLTAKRITHNDSMAIYREVKKAREEILRGQSGPVFLECVTYRWREHLGAHDDFGPDGRDRREAEPWIKKDELQRIGRLLTDKKREQIERKVEREVRDALAFAHASPNPRAADMWTHVYAQ